MSLGSHIRRLRHSLAPPLSQERLAAAAGMARTQLSELERGRVQALPEPAVLRALARRLQTSVVDLLRAAGYLEPLDAEAWDELAYRNLLLQAALVDDPELRCLIGALIADALATRRLEGG